MNIISKYSKFTPYLYFLAVIAYVFTNVNKNDGLAAYPILLCGIPFLWQLFKPNKQLNFTLGITFVCLSSYLIMVYISDLLHIIQLSEQTKQILTFGGVFVIANFIMALWMIRNSMKRRF
ncbi:MAG: hypothetical protein WA775_03995 [Psychroserpens sp.]|uniref:hypothetical protein n=1 Tax=Psychroserpens sp. TaxID=2020870 RepID=UPI003C9CAE4D